MCFLFNRKIKSDLKNAFMNRGTTEADNCCYLKPAITDIIVITGVQRFKY